ncbi:MAG: Lrp/AsnC family transcriptional regulator [Promethearchaeota archaeon]
MDAKDLKILELLIENSRLPYNTIGEEVNLTGNAVRARITSMMDDKVIENFVFKIRPGVFGVKSVLAAFFPKKADKFDTPEVLDKKIGFDPRFPEIITGINGRTVIRIYEYEEKNLQETIDELQFKMNNYKFSFLIRKKITVYGKISINTSLLKVINCLLQDVRMPIADISRFSNISSKSVKFYLNEIEQKDIGSFSVNFQPFKFSERIFLNFFISVPSVNFVKFVNLFNSLKKVLKRDLNAGIFKEILLEEPPGVFCDITVESIEEINRIEQKVHSYLKDDYTFIKMFPSRVIFRDNLVSKTVRDRISALKKEFD